MDSSKVPLLVTVERISLALFSDMDSLLGSRYSGRRLYLTLYRHIV